MISSNWAAWAGQSGAVRCSKRNSRDLAAAGRVLYVLQQHCGRRGSPRVRRWLFGGAGDHRHRYVALTSRQLAHLGYQLQTRHCDECLDALSAGAVERHRNRGKGLGAAADRVDGLDDEVVERREGGAHRVRLSGKRGMGTQAMDRASFSMRGLERRTADNVSGACFIYYPRPWSSNSFVEIYCENHRSVIFY